MTIASFFVFHETFPPEILRQRARRMRRTTNDPRYYAAVERLERGKSTLRLMGRALSRPLRLLATHPIIQITTVINALGYGLLYLMLSTLATLYIEHYGVNPQLSGLHYLAVAGGEILGSQISGPIMDWQYRRAARRLGGPPKPEARVPLMSWSLVGVPFGLVLYGWAAEYRKSWVAVDIGVVIVTCASQISTLPSQAYIMDVYPDHTSSAIGARQFLSSLAAFLFPLFAPAMYAALGYGWGNSVVAFVYLFLVVPAPWIIYVYGERLRGKVQSSE